MKLRFLLLLFSFALGATAAEVTIAGGVARPGRYSVAGDKGVIGVIVAAGGFSAAGCTDVRVLSQVEGKSRLFRVNVWELMVDFLPDWALQPGDSVVVADHTPACIRDVDKLDALMRDYLKARGASATKPANWKQKFEAGGGGHGQQHYDGAMKFEQGAESKGRP